MKKDKFLTIYAVLDEITQEKLGKIQQDILSKFPDGTQTMGIPFHISLGSFPLEDRKDLIARIGNKIEDLKPFSIELSNLDHFNYSVLFLRPKKTEALEKLHRLFEGNYSDGFPWEPHVTLYCGEQQVIKSLIEDYKISSIQATITGLQMGEFFPAKIILTATF